MGELSSKFDDDDIETLIKAMDDWEMIQNQEFHVLGMVKNMPMPPEDHEAFEMMSQLKRHYQNREKGIVADRSIRQEKSVFLKAKLMMARRDISIGNLFDMAANSEPSVPTVSTASTVEVARPEIKDIVQSAVAAKVAQMSEVESKLANAEFFIKDMGDGVWAYYQKFLTEKNS